jgi:5-methyltetrahydrofolate corrinoid/iron sulfur protein methyltransferase
MLIVGERINTSRKPIAGATETRDAAIILQEARQQVEAGAHVLDVNAGTFAEREGENLRWLVDTLQSGVTADLCIDSSDPDLIAELLQYDGRITMVNSITAEQEKFAAMLPLIKEFGCRTIALGLNDEGVAIEFDKKLKITRHLLDSLLSEGVPAEHIYTDPLVMAISTGEDCGIIALKLIEEIRNIYPDVHIICGLSNISFGLPVRPLLNRTFLAMAMTAGLDAVILDPLDRQMMSTVVAATTLLGKDRNCREYLAAYRKKRLE